MASQGKTRKEAHAMLAETVEAWLEAPSAREIKPRLKQAAPFSHSDWPMPKLQPDSANQMEHRLSTYALRDGNHR